MLGRPAHFLVAFLLAAGFMVEAALAESVFRLGRESDAKALDPPLTIENLDIWTMNNINSYLVRATKHADDLEARSGDALGYFRGRPHLHVLSARGQVLGRERRVTAQDAKFSIERGARP